jgi:hypothetical protein
VTRTSLIKQSQPVPASSTNSVSPSEAEPVAGPSSRSKADLWREVKILSEHIIKHRRMSLMPTFSIHTDTDDLVLRHVAVAANNNSA